MASTGLASVSGFVLNNWDIPPAQPINGVARGEIIFKPPTVLPVIPAVDAADTSIWTLLCNFPSNFYYRIIDLAVTVQCIDDNTLIPATGYQPGMMMETRTNQALPDALTDTHLLYNQQLLGFKLGGGFLAKMSVQFVDTTDSRVAVFSEYYPSHSQRLLDCSKNGNIFIRWVSDSTSAVNAVTVQWFIRALVYDQQQARHWLAQSPTALVTKV